MPNNLADTVKVLQGSDPSKRVLIVKRSDGAYAIRLERWYRSEWDGTIIAEGWKSLGTQPSFFASSDIAEREALSAYPWLKS